jgi:hypothetical protein
MDTRRSQWRVRSKLRRANLDVFLTVSPRPLGIPYYRDPQDSTSNSYIDLKSEPHRIQEIPEAKAWPALYRLLVQLNAPESQLMSFGCGVFIYDPQVTAEAQWSAYSYVGYGFADIARASDASIYFPQFFHFSRHFAARNNTGANVFFELRQASFIEGGAGAFVVDYGVRSSGDSPERLQVLVTDHFNALSDFLPLMGLTPLAEG